MTEELETQVEPVEKLETEVKEPQPSIEELSQEIERKEKVIKDLQNKVITLRRQGVPKEDIDALNKKIDGMQEWTAMVMDDLASRITQEDYEPPKQGKKTYSQLLEERRAKEIPKSRDPDVERFVTYLDSQGLEYDDPLVKEAVADDRSPREALKYLRDKIKSQSETEVEKRAQTLFEKMLKDRGLTAGGVEAPSAPSTSWEKLSPEEKILRGVSGKK